MHKFVCFFKRFKIDYLIVFLIGLIAIILHFFDIRICPIYNIFKIPCPGCGMTRATVEILKGRIDLSFRYNILCFPIYVAVFIKLLMVIFNVNAPQFTKKRLFKVIVIIVSVILLIISEIVNLNNQLLY